MLRLRHLLPFCLLWVTPAAGVIFYDSETPTYNTTAPPADSGWQYEGYFGIYLGTMISPNLFITAAHIGVASSTFNYDTTFSGTTSVSYNIDTGFNGGVGYYNIPGTDLNIFQVTGGIFSTYAPLYTGASKTLGFVDIGRGTQQGAAVTSSLGTITHGWLWGSGDHVARWGQNTFTGSVNGAALGLSGTLLSASFGSSNDITLSEGDSGGAAFVDVGGVWQLAGINYAVQSGPYSASPTGSNPFTAALYDMTGYYQQTSGGTWIPVTGASTFFLSDISANASAIQSVIAANPVPEPGGAFLIAIAALAAAVRRRR
ncbi:PEP-CTERM sorting domain-containing protein [Prosthecobacter sp.]|uniref:PEP-CTERM sorting domain-containing protein n=1 Tax=Prosthecobacter sp. TaxID=1965333 RepID=UPI002489B37F|nr:PEP-CTERM sorting domain-containing protein [Prosthecobacter sp.]MDI1312775.1 PEP-CTERM sorting domain-containing protein [Prosthecobacter sp.]